MGFQFSDDVHTVGNSVETCKDESKATKCPEEKWEDSKNNNYVCELFYGTRSSHEWDKENDENHSCG